MATESTPGTNFVEGAASEPFEQAAKKKIPKRVLDEIDDALNGYYSDIVVSAKKNAAKGHIYGDLKAQRVLGIAFSDEMVQRAAIEYADRYGRMLEREGATVIQGEKIHWLRGYRKETRTGIKKVLQEGLKAGKPVADISGKKAVEGTIAYDLKTYLEGQDSRLTMISRTELARFESQGAMNRYHEAGVTKVKIITASDPCEICAPLSGQIFEIDEAPEVPLHPNCRCAYAPVASSIQMQELPLTDLQILNLQSKFTALCNKRKDYKVTVISVRHYYDAGYEVRKESWEGPGEDMIMDSAYTEVGDYIGNPKVAYRLCVTKGIKPEKIDSTYNICSIGFCKKEQKWYGWSHRAIYGFGVGDEVHKGDCIEDLPVGFTVRTIEDAKKMAVAFARCVA